MVGSVSMRFRKSHQHGTRHIDMNRPKGEGNELALSNDVSGSGV